MNILLNVMCEFDDEAPEPEGTVLFRGTPKVGDEVKLSDGLIWVVTRVSEEDYCSYPVTVKRKE